MEPREGWPGPPRAFPALLGALPQRVCLTCSKVGAELLPRAGWRGPGLFGLCSASCALVARAAVVSPWLGGPLWAHERRLRTRKLYFPIIFTYPQTVTFDFFQPFKDVKAFSIDGLHRQAAGCTRTGGWSVGPHFTGQRSLVFASSAVRCTAPPSLQILELCPAWTVFLHQETGFPLLIGAPCSVIHVALARGWPRTAYGVPPGPLRASVSCL